jgi:hypothetical protein
VEVIAGFCWVGEDDVGDDGGVLAGVDAGVLAGVDAAEEDGVDAGVDDAVEEGDDGLLLATVVSIVEGLFDVDVLVVEAGLLVDEGRVPGFDIDTVSCFAVDDGVLVLDVELGRGVGFDIDTVSGCAVDDGVLVAVVELGRGLGLVVDTVSGCAVDACVDTPCGLDCVLVLAVSSG